MYNWQNLERLPSKSYTCGYCSESLASEKGYSSLNEYHSKNGYIYVCHHCLKPTFFNNSDIQTPGAVFGVEVKNIDDSSVEDIYEEARNAYSVNAFTACVLSCRKLLMHIAVSQGAKAGLSFMEYVEYLSNNNYIPPGAKKWVDHIRSKGNEANHEIVTMTKEDAEDLLTFIGMLLKIIYEFPANINQKVKSP